MPRECTLPDEDTGRSGLGSASSQSSRVVLLGGGTGCSRLAAPISRVLGPAALTVVANTADDLWHYGLRICPDLDSNMYALAGWQDRTRGWGIERDSFETMNQVRRLGEDAWFNLGDLDLATHLVRTGRLYDGESLSAITDWLTRNAGVTSRLIPMTNAEVATRVLTPAGEMGFQEFFVRHAADVEVVGVRWDGIKNASPAPGMIEAIGDAEMVIIGPSSPVASVLPILELTGVRDAMTKAGRVVAVTPVVSGIPIVDKGEKRRARSRAALMGAVGLPHTATSVASLYEGLADVFVLDVADAPEAKDIEALGLDVHMTHTLVTDHATGDRLATELLST